MTNACPPRRRVPRVLIGTGLLVLAASRITAQQVIPKGVYGMMAGVMA